MIKSKLEKTDRQKEIAVIENVIKDIFITLFVIIAISSLLRVIQYIVGFNNTKYLICLYILAAICGLFMPKLKTLIFKKK